MVPTCSVTAAPPLVLYRPHIFLCLNVLSCFCLCHCNSLPPAVILYQCLYTFSLFVCLHLYSLFPPPHSLSPSLLFLSPLLSSRLDRCWLIALCICLDWHLIPPEWGNMHILLTHSLVLVLFILTIFVYISLPWEWSVCQKRLQSTLWVLFTKLQCPTTSIGIDDCKTMVRF